MSTAVEIRVVQDDPDRNDYTTIEVTKDGEIEAVLAAATVLLVPYGKLLTTRPAALNHLLDRLLDVTGEPDPVDLSTGREDAAVLGDMIADATTEETT